METWKDIPSTEGRYQISDHGRVKRKLYKRTNSNHVASWEQEYREKILTGSVDSHGYRQATFYVGGEKTVRFVHRLVAENFLNPPSEVLVAECLKTGHKKVFVNHKDEDPLNNHVDNLEWCTPAYNVDYSPQEYSRTSGDNCKHAILTEEIVDKILQLKGMLTQKKLAAMFGVQQVTISNIFTGRSWSAYTGIPRKERRKGKAAAKTKSISQSERR